MNANTYDSPSTTGGNREDLRGPLRYVEPEETPFTSLVRMGPAPKSTLVEHGADTYRNPVISGTREGDSGSKGGNKATKRQRFGSYLHRWQDSFGVTDVQQLITERGGNAFVSDEYDWAMAKCLREVKRDVECALCSHQDGQGGSDDQMRTRGAFQWLETSTTPTIPSDFHPPAAQRLSGVATLIETGTNSLNSVLKSLKASYGSAREYQCFIGNDYQEDADMFTRTQGETTEVRYSVTDSASSGTINLFVKVFNSSFGRVNFIGTEWLRYSSTTNVGDADALIICNMELWELLWLEELQAYDDEEDAGGVSGYVKGIGGLFCLNPKGNAYVYNS